MLALAALALVGAVLAAVHHAEVVAHRVGEPFGTLILAVAVTVIEVALIVSMMPAAAPTSRRCRATRSSRRTWAAVRAARADRLQTSFNLALGSALASIGLTIPAVALASFVLGMLLQLGLAPKDLVLLALTFAVGAITLGTGRTNVLQGAVQLVIFATFLFLSLVP